MSECGEHMQKKEQTNLTLNKGLKDRANGAINRSLVPYSSLTGLVQVVLTGYLDAKGIPRAFKD